MPHPIIAFLAPGGGEMLVVMLALLLLFGPKDAPRILREILDSLRKIRQTATRFKNELLADSLRGNTEEQDRSTAIYDAEESAPENEPVPPPPPPAEKGPPS